MNEDYKKTVERWLERYHSMHHLLRKQLVRCTELARKEGKTPEKWAALGCDWNSCDTYVDVEVKGKHCYVLEFGPRTVGIYIKENDDTRNALTGFLKVDSAYTGRLAGYIVDDFERNSPDIDDALNACEKALDVLEKRIGELEGLAQ